MQGADEQPFHSTSHHLGDRGCCSIKGDCSRRKHQHHPKYNETPKCSHMEASTSYVEMVNKESGRFRLAGSCHVLYMQHSESGSHKSKGLEVTRIGCHPVSNQVVKWLAQKGHSVALVKLNAMLSFPVLRHSSFPSCLPYTKQS